MDKLSSLNWIGICVLFLGIVAFMLGKQEKYTTLTVVLCIVGVILFIMGFYVKK